ncbi:MAG TPA: site-specific DNA-methyltransferase [Pirellulales bacterium]|nr:site-specific DNA-methyltransferase [Pirellulales bacterium]
MSRLRSKAASSAKLNGQVAPSTAPIELRGANSSLSGQNKWGGHVHGISWEVRRGDAETVLALLQPDRFKCVVTSPPYYSQRDYEVEGQIGLEKTFDAYVDRIVSAMEAVHRVLAPDGLLFLNLGDTYYSGRGQPKGVDRKNGARRFGLRPVDASGLGVSRKTTIGIPWRVALRLIDGEKKWILRSPIIWRRDGSIPEPTAHDRPWRTHEMLFMFSKQPRYYFSRAALQCEEDIWAISSRPKSSKGVHSAAFPDELVRKCLDAGCPAGGDVLDPFAGSGTVLRVAIQSGRPALGIDLSEPYCEHMAKTLTSLGAT